MNIIRIVLLFSCVGNLFLSDFVGVNDAWFALREMVWSTRTSIAVAGSGNGYIVFGIFGCASGFGFIGYEQDGAHVGVKGEQEVDEGDEQDAEYGARDIAETDDLRMQEVGRVTEERAQLGDHRDEAEARKVEGINDRYSIGKVEVALVHFRQKERDRQGEYERYLERDITCQCFLAPQQQEADEQDEQASQGDADPFPELGRVSGEPLIETGGVERQRGR